MRTASMVVLCLSTHAAAMHPGSMKRPHPRQSDRISTVVRDDGSVLASAADDAKREWLDRLDAPTWGARQVAHTAAPTVATSAVAPTVGDVGVVVPRGYDIDTTRDQEPNVSSPPLANFKAAHGGVSSRAPRPAAATDVSASPPRTAAELESRIAELTAELAKAGPAPVAATPSAMGGALSRRATARSCCRRSRMPVSRALSAMALCRSASGARPSRSVYSGTTR